MPRYKFDEAKLLELTGGDRAQAEALVAEFKETLERVPLEGYTPHVKQAKFHASRAVLRGFFGGNRAGKTTAGVVDDLLEVTPRELVPPHLQRWKRPEWECPRYVRMGMPSTKQINQIAAEKFKEWTPRDLLHRGGWDKSYSKYEYVLRLECECKVEFLSYEMDLDKWGGSAQHRCHYDEEPPQPYREEGRARLTDFGGIEVVTMTPLLGMTWTYDELWLASEWDEDVFAISASMTENPALDPEGVRQTLKAYAGFPELAEARVHGRFVHFGGLVYPRWQEWIGERPPVDFIRACDVVIAVDPGARGFGIVFIAFDAFNNAIVFATSLLLGNPVKGCPAKVFPQGANVSHAAAEIRRIAAEWGLDPGRCDLVIDPAARARSAISSATIETEFANEGLYFQHAQNEREAGVLMVRRRGEAGALAISEDCEAWRWEAQRYRVADDRADGRFDVVKEHDHIMDAFRYGIMHRPWDPLPEQLVSQAVYPADTAQPPPRALSRPGPPEGPFV